MNQQPPAVVNTAVARAQAVLLGEIDEQGRLLERMRDAEALSRELLTALQEREAQVLRLIEENHALHRRAAGYGGSDHG